MGTPYSTLTYEVEDRVAVLTLDRPEVRNALNLEMRAELADLFPRIRADKDLRSLVVTGAQGAFCAGGDLMALSAEKRSVDANRERIALLHTWFTEWVNLELPVIAAVDGPAYGAGFNMALACDFILASDRARFCAVFCRIGLVPDLGGFFLLPRIVGLQRAKELVMTARSFGAEEARDYGIVLETHPSDKLMQAAIEFAGRFRNASPVAAGQAKAIMNQSFHLDQHVLAQLEASAQSICLESDYHAAAVRRFKEKQPLEFDWDRLTREAK